MSYSNGLLLSKQSDYHYQISGKGEKGDPGIGFKLTDSGDYDKKKLVNVAEGSKHGCYQ